MKLFKNKKMITIYTLITLFLAWVAWGYFSVASVEKPKYNIIEKKENYEIRQYKPYLIAEVKVEGNYREGLNKGFSKVADYIFGNNTKKENVAMTSPVVRQEEGYEKIAMTTPVVNNNEASGEQYISFIMPSKYNIENLPTPNNKEVKIKEVPAQKIAVLKFSWYATTNRIKAKESELRKSLEESNLKYNSIKSAFYNPPWTPPFMLRNEIWAMLEN